MAEGKDSMAPEPFKIVGYTRVSTGEQEVSGLGLAAQRAAIREEADRRGWKMVRVFEDSASGKSVNGREGLRQALSVLESGRASGLVVAKLDRLSRSLLDFATLLERAHRKGWAVIALDLGVDTSTPSGEMLVHVLASFAQFERRMISTRTKDALAQKHKRGGYAYGRPAYGYRAEGGELIPDENEQKVIARMIELRVGGLSLRAIADKLAEEGVKPRHAEKWSAEVIGDILRR